MIKNYLSFILILFSLITRAQSLAEILSISLEKPSGTARFESMGGAFGSLGGDLSSININPAGGAVFIDNEFVHQGFAALVSPLENLDLETFIQSDLENKKRSVFIILDGIEDDRNIGSIIRSSSALGADGIIINKREFRNKSFHMHKTASGAMEYIPIFAVSNVVNAIDILKKNNFWIYAMDGKANNSIFKEKFSTKVSFVFGSESNGMRKIVLNHSDNILFIPMKNKIDSLNVSNAVAATLAIYNSIK